MDSPPEIWIRRRSFAKRRLFVTAVRVLDDDKKCSGLLISRRLCRFEVPPECSVELSPHGYQFFAELFQVFDKVSAQVLLSERKNAYG